MINEKWTEASSADIIKDIKSIYNFVINTINCIHCGKLTQSISRHCVSCLKKDMKKSKKTMKSFPTGIIEES